MKTVTRWVRFAAGAALIGALTSLGWSQQMPQKASATNDLPLFARVDAYLDADVSALERYFLASLDYPSAGVVESALREITRVKLAQPWSSSSALKDKFRKLAEEGETPAIRYKSILGLQVFENPELFLDLAYRDFRTDDEMFTAISRRLEKSLLAGML